LRNVDVATADRSETSDLCQVRERDLRAALAGMEASAERLSRHRELLTDPQLDELTRSLAHEARPRSRSVRSPATRRLSLARITGDRRDALVPAHSEY